MMKPTEKETSDTEDEEEHFTVVIKRRKLRSVAACFMFLSMVSTMCFSVLCFSVFL